MGLDISHDCWRGAYSSFMRWRTKIAEVAELPPLLLMEGYYHEESLQPFLKLSQNDRSNYPGLPIKWSALKPDPYLYELLYHSDCDGEIGVGSLIPLAERLEELIPLLPDEDAGGHIGNWRYKTKVFIGGLLRASDEGVPIKFM